MNFPPPVLIQADAGSTIYQIFLKKYMVLSIGCKFFLNANCPNRNAYSILSCMLTVEGTKHNVYH